MGIRQTTQPSDIDGFLRNAAELVRRYILNALTKLGEESVVKIRNRPQNISWIDHTSNLRSSIGYSVYEDGVSYMQSAFEVLGSGSKGHSEGVRMVQELARQYSDTYALVVVAAMDYADKVEAIESKDVLESTRLWAETVVKERLDRAVAEAVKVINTWKI